MTQTKLVTTQTSQPSLEPITPINPSPTGTASGSSPGAIHLLGIVAIWGTALWSVARSRKASPRARIRSSESNIPCQNCQFFHGDLGVAIAVGISLFAISLIASIAGSGLPFLFQSFKLDPALMSAPFITTAVDVFGVLVYLNVARWILRL